MTYTVRVVKSRELEDLNPYLVARKREWCEGALATANFVNEHKAVTYQGYLAGDIALFKFNLIKKRQLRKLKPTFTTPKRRKRRWVSRCASSRRANPTSPSPEVSS